MKVSEKEFREFFEHLPVIFYVTSPDRIGSILYVSPQVKEILGWTREEFEADPGLWLKMLHQEDRERVLNWVDLCREPLRPFICEYRMSTKDGATVWFRDEARIVRRSGTWVLQGLMLNITERKTMEDALRDGEERFRAIFETAQDCIFIKDVSLHYTHVNPSMEKLFASPASALVGKTDADLFGEEISLTIREQDREVLNGNCVVAEHSKPVRGSLHTFHVIKSPLRDRQWRIAGLCGIARDITERRLSEEALRESEQQLRLLSSRLLNIQEEERKRIAAEIHDSIGSSLTAIKFRLEHTVRQMEEGTETPESMRTIIALLQHTIGETRRLMSDLRPPILDDLGIISTIQWFCRQFQSYFSGIEIERNVRIEEQAVAAGLKIVIFRIMQEAFHNIAKHSGATYAKLSLEGVDSGIALSVEDNGQGFDLEEVLSKNTCRESFGLDTMRERTELSGGSFLIESAAGAGTRIRATWPRTEA